ncbi:topoisomerase II [bacterium]|nr:topoisomerase II [bacterium]
MAKPNTGGTICANTAYSKRELMTRLRISQRFWDKMLNNGLPFAEIGHERWVWGQKVIEYIEENSKRKNDRS